MERFGLTCRRLCFFNSVFVCISLKTTRDNCIYRIKYFATTFSSSFDCLFFSLLSIRQFLIQFIVNFRVQFFFTFDFHLFKLMEIICFVVIVFFSCFCPKTGLSHTSFQMSIEFLSKCLTLSLSSSDFQTILYAKLLVHHRPTFHTISLHQD